MVNDEKILLSVIIPVYNTRKQLKKCLESVINQTYKKLQIIVIDDGSDDGSENICDYYAESDNRLEVYHKKNGGLLSARKAGANLVKGDYVISVDSDDWIEPEYFRTFVDAIEKSGMRQIWSISYYRDYYEKSYLDCTNINGSISDIENQEIQEYLFSKAIGKYGYRDDVPYYMWSKCIEKELFVYMCFSLDDNINYHEDVSFSIRCIAADNHILFINNSGYHYVQRDDSVSHVVGEKDIKALQVVRENTLEFLKQFGNYQYTKNVSEGAYLCAMVVKNFEGLQNPQKECLVPFEDIHYGSKIVVYGMGNVGKVICQYLAKNINYELVACSDTRKIQMIENEYNYVEPEKISKIEFDYVIIATVKINLIKEIKDKLLCLSIPERKIKFVPGLISD